MEKFELQETLDKINELQREGKLDQMDLCIGEYEDEPFMIVHSHEDIAKLTALINGYTGNSDLAVVWDFEDLNKEFDKAEAELKSTPPNHFGTISRLERRLKQLVNLSAYKRWLLENEIEEKELGIELGFSDEYSVCSECYSEVIRTSPDSYSWQPDYYLGEGEIVCAKCLESGNYDEIILDTYKNEQKAIPDTFDLDRLGLVQINKESFQNGFFAGQDDSPDKVIEALNNEEIDCWFTVAPSQFYTEFNVLVRQEDFDRAKKILDGTDTYQGYSTSGNLEKALKGISKESAKVSGEGIRYTKVDVQNGTSETRLVSKEEFIDGIKE